MANTYSANFVRASTQYLSAADSASLSGTGNLTIEAHLYVESAPSSGQAYSILSKWIDAGNRSWFWDYFNNGGTLQFRFATSSNGSNGSTASFNYDLGVQTWVHAAITYTAATGAVELYISQSHPGSGSVSHTSIFDSNAPVHIGATEGANTWNGKIDEVRIWNVARTDTEIYDNFCTAIDSASNLQASWGLNNALTDSSGNGNTLTNNNGVTFSQSRASCYPSVGGGGLCLLKIG